MSTIRYLGQLFESYGNPVISKISMNVNIRNKISFFFLVAFWYEHAVGTRSNLFWRYIFVRALKDLITWPTSCSYPNGTQKMISIYHCSYFPLLEQFFQRIIWFGLFLQFRHQRSKDFVHHIHPFLRKRLLHDLLQHWILGAIWSVHILDYILWCKYRWKTLYLSHYLCQVGNRLSLL